MFIILYHCPSGIPCFLFLPCFLKNVKWPHSQWIVPALTASAVMSRYSSTSMRGRKSHSCQTMQKQMSW